MFSNTSKINFIKKYILLFAFDLFLEAAMGVFLGAQMHNKSTLEYVSAVRR